MFGLGWTEMLVVGVVALIVIGPKDLPVVMHRIGKALSSIRRMGSEFQRELNKATGLNEITDLRKSITEPLKQTAADIRSEFNKPTAGGGTEPSGAIKPADPSKESVVKEIHERIGTAAPQPYTPFTKEAQEKYRAAQQSGSNAVAAAKPVAAPIESPAPPEAVAPPARKPRAPRKPKAAASGDTPAPAKTAAAAADKPARKVPARKAAAKKAPAAAKPAPKAEPEA